MIAIGALARVKRRFLDALPAAAAFGWPAADRSTAAFFRQAGTLALVALVVFLCLSAYEALALGRPPLGERPPAFKAYDLLRTAGALLFSGAIAWLAHRAARRNAAPADAIGRPGSLAAAALAAAGIASVMLMLASPLSFAALSAEDGPVEWLSAAALFAGSAFFLHVAVRGPAGAADRRPPARRLHAALAIGLCGLLFLAAMEEISWTQRVLQFETPSALATVNHQGEFNLHNLHTDYSENVYYLGAFALLILLPLLAHAAPWLRALPGVSEFIPGAWVAAAAAPSAMLNYGMWNVLPMQVSMMLTVLTMLTFAAGGHRRGAERLLFPALAAGIVLGQVLLLASGHRMTQIFDASEYKELFIALGLACFALDAELRHGRLSRRPAAQERRGRAVESGGAAAPPRLSLGADIRAETRRWRA